MKRKATMFLVATMFLMMIFAGSVSAELRTATFDNIVSWNNLANYSEGNLKITTPTSAYVAYDNDFPSLSPDYPGFTRGFFYPIGGVSAPITVQALDGAQIYDLQFNAGDGWSDHTNVDLFWDIWDGGSIVSNGYLNILKGTLVDISYQDGFDYIDLYAGSTGSVFSMPNALAIDNLVANTAPGCNTVPEPASLLLLGLGLLGLAGFRKK